VKTTSKGVKIPWADRAYEQAAETYRAKADREAKAVKHLLVAVCMMSLAGRVAYGDSLKPTHLRGLKGVNLSVYVDRAIDGYGRTGASSCRDRYAGLGAGRTADEQRTRRDMAVGGGLGIRTARRSLAQEPK